MRSPTYDHLAGVLVVFSFLHLSCGSGSGASTWQDPEYEGPEFRKVVVLVEAEDMEVRQAIENTITAMLDDRGYTAVPSLSLFPHEDKREYTQVEADLQKEGIDAILVAEKVGSEDIQEYSAGHTYYQNYSEYYDTRTARRTSRAEPAQVKKIGTDRLIWRAESDLGYYGDLKATASQFATTVVGYLAGSGLLYSGSGPW
jgi:hypothetical protein